MDLRPLYFDGRPNWRVLQQRLDGALSREGLQIPVELVQLTTTEEAEPLRFRGSPSLLLDDRDVFADPSAQVGLPCRVHATPDGLQGAPTVGQLTAALAAALALEP